MAQLPHRTSRPGCNIPLRPGGGHLVVRRAAGPPLWIALLVMVVPFSLAPFRIGMTVLMLNIPRQQLQLATSPVRRPDGPSPNGTSARAGHRPTRSDPIRPSDSDGTQSHCVVRENGLGVVSIPPIGAGGPNGMLWGDYVSPVGKLVILTLRDLRWLH
jgi:hypothetical protein